MKTNATRSLFTIIIVFCLTVLISAQTSKESVFKVNKGDKLEASLSQGEINITTGSGSEVKVTAKNIDEGEIELLTMEQKGNKIEIRFEGDDSDNFKLMLSIPSALDLELSTGGGNITINGQIDGKVVVSTGGGNITTQKINGVADLSTGGGNINVEDVNGNADISTGGGEIRVGTINGIADLSTGGGNISVKSVNNSADISTSGGNIYVGEIGGKGDVSTGGGNISVGGVSGSADISTGGGNISLESAKGNVEVSSGAGNINLKNINGPVDLGTGSGKIYAELNPDGKSKSELLTGMGSIELLVPETAQATIVASTTVITWSGNDSDLKNITSDFEPATIDRIGNQVKVTYVLNGGGSVIKLTTGMGDIKISKKK